MSYSAKSNLLHLKSVEMVLGILISMELVLSLASQLYSKTSAIILIKKSTLKNSG